MVPLNSTVIVMDPAVLIFLNRLSDYLFNAARRAAQLAGKPEVIYCKK